jgi:hypothetical protein
LGELTDDLLKGRAEDTRTHERGEFSCCGRWLMMIMIMSMVFVGGVKKIENLLGPGLDFTHSCMRHARPDGRVARTSVFAGK